MYSKFVKTNGKHFWNFLKISNKCPCTMLKCRLQSSKHQSENNVQQGNVDPTEGTANMLEGTRVYWETRRVPYTPTDGVRKSSNKGKQTAILSTTCLYIPEKQYLFKTIALGICATYVRLEVKSGNGKTESRSLSNTERRRERS
jgi:hypothetical protein